MSMREKLRQGMAREVSQPRRAGALLLANDAGLESLIEAALDTLLEPTDEMIAAMTRPMASFERGSIEDQMKAFAPVMKNHFQSAVRVAKDGA